MKYSNGTADQKKNHKYIKEKHTHVETMKHRVPQISFSKLWWDVAFKYLVTCLCPDDILI